MLKIILILFLLSIQKSMQQTCLNETKCTNNRNIIENLLNKELINPYEIKELSNDEEYITLFVPFIVGNNSDIEEDSNTTRHSFSLIYHVR